jgi:hypothetical protein
MRTHFQVPLAALLLTSFASLALADGVPATQWAKDCVAHRLINPLVKQEKSRSRFSREGPPPSERRVNVVEAEFRKDQSGREFIPYEVDARYGEDWHPSLKGCVYRGTGNVFVEIGDEYRPAAFILGKDVAAVPGACQGPKAQDPA